jgi:hypothetical protein
MYRKETSRKDLGDAFWGETGTEGVETGAGCAATTMCALECATEQIEHSWAEEFELAL